MLTPGSGFDLLDKALHIQSNITTKLCIEQAVTYAIFRQPIRFFIEVVFYFHQVTLSRFTSWFDTKVRNDVCS